jgi:hypothetical protein
MGLRMLDKKRWHLFLDHVTRERNGRHVEIEAASPKFGDQIVVSWRELIGIAYDPRNDVLEVALVGLDHLVRAPREIYIDGPPVGWRTMAVLDAEGVLRIVRLREPLLLPEHTEIG